MDLTGFYMMATLAFSELKMVFLKSTITSYFTEKAEPKTGISECHFDFQFISPSSPCALTSQNGRTHFKNLAGFGLRFLKYV